MPARRPSPASDLADLRARLRRFAGARDWQPFHTPKNLAAALAVEAAELLEHFQWLTPEESARLPRATRAEVAAEIADVLLYLIRLADVLDIDLVPAARRKLRINARKYPVKKARGRSTKYNRL
jgi:NTP pyrophosphatase (non-canonical NTP hydrolase)